MKKEYRCKVCGASDRFRCPVYQSVDVELDANGNVLDNGINFTDPEVEEDKVFCDKCGTDVNA